MLKKEAQTLTRVANIRIKNSSSKEIEQDVQKVLDAISNAANAGSYYVYIDLNTPYTKEEIEKLGYTVIYNPRLSAMVSSFKQLPDYKISWEE